MSELNLPRKLGAKVSDFLIRLRDIYKEDLISVFVYGSAASGEFTDKHSNLNLLVILRSLDLENLKKSSGLIKRYRHLRPLFLSRDYIAQSLDVFPIEFLDLKENHCLLYGNDFLKDIDVDSRNLRFQCEQELKAKLINLKHLFLKLNRDKAELKALLFKSFTSILHILRNVLRLKGKDAPYKKEEILKSISTEFPIDLLTWQRILAAKLHEVRLRGKEIEELFTVFIRDLEKIIEVVDKL